MHHRESFSQNEKKYCYLCKKWLGKHFFKPKKFIDKRFIFHIFCLLCAAKMLRFWGTIDESYKTLNDTKNIINVFSRN